MDLVLILILWTKSRQESFKIISRDNKVRVLRKKYNIYWWPCLFSKDLFTSYNSGFANHRSLRFSSHIPNETNMVSSDTYIILRSSIGGRGVTKGYDFRFPFESFQNIRFPSIVIIDFRFRIGPNLFLYQCCCISM